MNRMLRPRELDVSAENWTEITTRHFAETDETSLTPTPSMGVHPMAIGIALGASAILLVAAWLTFAGGETSLVLAIVTVLLAVLFACLVGGGMMAPDVTPGERKSRSFAAFLDGEVDIATGKISGREALLQITALPITLMAGGIAILAIAVWTS